jgi:c-di-GMP-binding flagellar brake protein YcgR
MNMTEPVAAQDNDPSPLTVPTVAEPLTIPSAAAVATIPAVSGAAKRAVVRELASWRVLKMWANGDVLANAVTVKLIGVHEGHSIIVAAPESAATLPLNNGAMYQFRSFSGESTYEFAAPLLKVCSEPFEYLHIGWPQQRHVEKRELRAAARVKTELQCMVYPGTQTSARFVKGTITDLSTGGAAITLHDELSLFYDEIKVVFQLPVAEQDIMIEARARPVRKPEETGERMMGVSFVALGQPEKLALHAFVHAALVRELEVPLYAQA